MFIMAQMMSLMESFSQRERFIWHGDAFNVIIPNGTRTAYHPRATQSYLRALLMPQLRLTRAGNISLHQPPPPSPQPYDFYLAQLIHYGLDFHFEIEKAQRALEIEITLGRLRVPSGLRALEKELRKAHEQQYNGAHKDSPKYVARQRFGDIADAAIYIDTSEDESEDRPVRPIRTSGLPSAPKRNKKKVITSRSHESDTQSSRVMKSSESENQAGDESDTIVVAADIEGSTSSDTPSASSSEEVIKIKRSDVVPRGYTSTNGESSPEEGSREDNSSEEDPFIDRRVPKRVKLEKVEGQKRSVFKSTPASAPSIVQKRVPPSKAKVRRIASQRQTNVRPVESATEEGLGTRDATINLVSSGRNLVRTPFVSSDKRPAWTLPVRSPSTSHRTTPKSVTFSQGQCKTPTKVNVAENVVLSPQLKTRHGSLHRRTPSSSSERSRTTPLRSILKRNDALPDPTQSGSIGRRPEISIRLPLNANLTSSRPRPRKRKRKSGADSRPVMALDGAQDDPDKSDEPGTEKPYIKSDIVNGKPVSSLKKLTIVQAVQPSPLHLATPAMSSVVWTAVNAKTYLRQQQRHAAQAGNQKQTTDMTGKLRQTREALQSNGKLNRQAAPASARSLQSHTSAKTAPTGSTDPGNDGFGNGLHMGWGSGSRGGLVRAGQVY